MDNGQFALLTSACHDSESIINAPNNWWGVADSAGVEASIYHHNDDADHPTVIYMPYAANPFVIDVPAGVGAITDYTYYCR